MQTNKSVRSRRSFLKAGAAIGVAPLTSACGGGSAEAANEIESLPTSATTAAQDAAAQTPAQVPTLAPPTQAPQVGPLRATVTGAYRPGQPYLFQSVAAAKYQSTIGGGDYSADVWGPTHLYVDFQSGWAWTNPGGDWIDLNLQKQGTVPWASFALNSAAGSSTAFTYGDMDVTNVVQHCQANNRWMAFALRRTGAVRSIASAFSSTPPAIDVTYADGTSEALSCRLIAVTSSGNFSPSTANDRTPLPCLAEFSRPSKTVVKAALSLTVTEHWSGSPAFLQIFLVDPPLNTEPVTGRDGLASLAGAADDGITVFPQVIGAQRYIDGSTLSDFAVLGKVLSTSSEANYDPALWGGAQDLTKYPHISRNKWVDVPAGLSIVPSSYDQEGFEPLRPGLGALRLHMADAGIKTGQEGGQYGTRAINSRLFMPFEEMGLLDHIFVRQYVRFGKPHMRTPMDRREVFKQGLPVWSDLAGKFGITPSHTTTYGGVSGSSGGGKGWQLRLSWQECEAGVGGPNESGVQLGWHLYDFQNANPVGYRYGTEASQNHNWGKMGGHGATLYAGRWYCIETELKLNSINAADNTFDPNGILRTWIDGKLTYERTGMVFRTLPLHMPTFNGSFLRPCRELGIRDLWWNWFNGGLTQSTVNRTVFTTGLVWAKSRIGEMK